MRNPLSVALFTLMLSPLAAFAQQQFATPEQAATALAEAISQPNEAALSEVLGDNWQQFFTHGRDRPCRRRSLSTRLAGETCHHPAGWQSLARCR